MKRIAVLVFLGVFAFTGGWGCSGSSPTDTKLDPTPVPPPVVSATPTPTPKPGTTPTPTPVPTISISVVTSSFNPPAGSNVVVGQQVYLKFGVSGFTAGDLIIVRTSEDGVTPSPNGISTSVSVASLVTSMFSMQTTGKTVALLFYHYVNGGTTIVQVPNSTYMVTYNWVSPTQVVSIGPGGVFIPRDSGILPVGTVVTYRNDDTKLHQPNSTNSGMVNCPGMFPGGFCTFTVLNLTGGFTRVSVADLYSGDGKEAHTFTVDP